MIDIVRRLHTTRRIARQRCQMQELPRLIDVVTVDVGKLAGLPDFGSRGTLQLNVGKGWDRGVALVAERGPCIALVVHDAGS